MITDVCTKRLLKEVPAVPGCDTTRLYFLFACCEILAYLQFQLAFLALREINCQMVCVNFPSICKSFRMTLILQWRMQNGGRGRLTVDRDHSRWGLSGLPRCLFVLSHRFPNNGSVKGFVVRQLDMDTLVYCCYFPPGKKKKPCVLQPGIVSLKITSFPMLLCGRSKRDISLSYFGGL